MFLQTRHVKDAYRFAYDNVYSPASSESQRNALRAATVDQGESPTWFLERRKRITASNAGLLMKASDNSGDLSKLVRRLQCQVRTGPGCKIAVPMQYGLSHEGDAARAYIARAAQNLGGSKSVTLTGIDVSPTHP